MTEQRRILVIDDDKALRVLFRAIFNRAGFEVECATDAADGFVRLRDGEYDAVILDLMMPGTNGFDVLERIAIEKPQALAKVIVASGASRRVLERVDTTRIHALVRKPFDLEELLKTTVECAVGHA